jgi:hypothetical protein
MHVGRIVRAWRQCHGLTVGLVELAVSGGVWRARGMDTYVYWVADDSMGDYIRYEHRTRLTTILVLDNMDNKYACKIGYGESGWPWTLGGIGDVVATNAGQDDQVDRQSAVQRTHRSGRVFDTGIRMRRQLSSYWGCPRRSKIAQPSVSKRSSVSRRPRALEKVWRRREGAMMTKRGDMGNMGLSDREAQGLKR